MAKVQFPVRWACERLRLVDALRQPLEHLPQIGAENPEFPQAPAGPLDEKNSGYLRWTSGDRADYFSEHSSRVQLLRDSGRIMTQRGATPMSGLRVFRGAGDLTIR